MAIYYCTYCGYFKDDDWHPGEEDPDDSIDLICPDCLDKRAEEAENEINGEDYRKPRVPFNINQRFI